MIFRLPIFFVRSLLLLIFSQYLSVSSQTPIWYPDQQPFIRYYEQLKLSNDQVFSLKQDRHGYLWLGAGDLIKYDGYTARRFRNPGHEPFKEMYKYLFIPIVAKYARTWVVYSTGTYIFDPITESFKQVSIPEPRECVETKDGTIWCTSSKGILNFSFTARNQPPKVQQILAEPYHHKLFPLLEDLEQNGKRIFSLTEEEITKSNGKFKLEVFDSTTYFFFAIHDNHQTFQVLERNEEIWHSEDSLSTNTKSLHLQTSALSNIQNYFRK